MQRFALLGDGGHHRVQQERHVVGDDLNDGVPTRPFVGRDGWREDVHHRRPLRPVGTEAQHVGGRADHVHRVLADQVLRGDILVEA
jgi:hypothetical protein